MVVEYIYRNALRSLSNGTESVEGRESEGGELERDHCCLSIWFLGEGGAVQEVGWDLQRQKHEAMASWHRTTKGTD